jgi:putative SOS response-associated peptidase YedK
MCGRFASSSRAVARLAAGLRLQVQAVAATENQAPGQPAPVAVQRSEGPRIEGLRWGVPPPWQGSALLLARAETAARKPAFRELFRRRRCLVPAEAFYEWQAGTRPKQPWRFSLASGEPLVMAGLWQAWRDEAGQESEGFLLLTTAANASVAPCHDRMPALLAPEAWTAWLDPEASPDTLQPLLRPWPEPMTAWPVTPALNRADYAGPVTRVEAPLRQTELFTAPSRSVTDLRDLQV